MALDPIPPIEEPLVDERRRITPRWRKYLQARDGALTAFEARIAALEATAADHEARITALEPP